MAKKKKPVKGDKKKSPKKEPTETTKPENQCLNCGEPIPDGELYCSECEEERIDYDIFD